MSAADLAFQLAMAGLGAWIAVLAVLTLVDHLRGRYKQ